jgi:hypothetical protein
VNGALSALGMPSELMYRYLCGERPADAELAALPEAARRFQDHPSEGFVSTRTIGELISLVCPSGWPERGYWAVAVDLESGRRVALGSQGAPRTDVARERRAWGRFGRRLGWERRRLERSGTPVLLIQPSAADLEVIPVNPMRAAERSAVATRALETTVAGFETRRDWLEPLHTLRRAADAA